MLQIYFNDSWRQAEAWIMLFVGEVEMNTHAQGALRRVTQFTKNLIVIALQQRMGIQKPERFVQLIYSTESPPCFIKKSIHSL